jgi:DNA-binding response OmpR family regulator
VDYIRVYVRRLRDKLGDDPERPRYIRTERGLGYRFIRPAGQSPRPVDPVRESSSE